MKFDSKTKSDYIFFTEDMLPGKSWIMESNFKWKPYNLLGRDLHVETGRPPSPTIKVCSPNIRETAIFCNKFDDMEEWKKTIDIVAYFTRNQTMFDNHRHLQMRFKLMDAHLNTMERIVEDVGIECSQSQVRYCTTKYPKGNTTSP